MHIEQDYTRVERFITAHRARLAYALMATLAIILYVAWHVVSRVWGIESSALDLCVMGLSAAGGAIAALAFYWSAE